MGPLEIFDSIKVGAGKRAVYEQQKGKMLPGGSRKVIELHFEKKWFLKHFCDLQQT